MGFVDSIMDRLAQRLGRSIQANNYTQGVRDYHLKHSSYSVECEISEKLANMVCMLSSMPISGESERATWLDAVSDRFFQSQIVKLLITAFTTGDCLVVPSWNGRNIQNVLVGADDFAILATSGDEITAVAYLVDTVSKGAETYRLYQAVELVPYEANDGTTAYANRYRMFVSKGESVSEAGELSSFPEWAARYETDWYIPNVDRLLIGRFKTAVIDPLAPNNVKGLPICYGASEPIAEFRYLLNTMHNEFKMSEKMILADKRFFKRNWKDGQITTELPRGRERLFEAVPGQSDMVYQEWAPDIRYNAFLEDLDKQEQLIERAVGVSRGIISSPNDMNYQNVDNVRKSQQSTIAFINTARGIAEGCLTDLLYAWNMLANYYSIVPIGDFMPSFDWSDDYIETFSDRQNAILAGETIGATDAVDYRQFVFDESPEAARQRVEEIQASKAPTLTLGVE